MKIYFEFTIFKKGAKLVDSVIEYYTKNVRDENNRCIINEKKIKVKDIVSCVTVYVNGEKINISANTIKELAKKIEEIEIERWDDFQKDDV